MDDNVKRLLFGTRVLAFGAVAAFAGSAAITYAGTSLALDAEVSSVTEVQDDEDDDDERDLPTARSPVAKGGADKTTVAAGIVDRNPFCPSCKPVEAVPEAGELGGPTRPGEIPTTLPFALLGTMEADNPRYSMATIQDTERGTLGAFGVDDPIRDGVVLMRVERGRVVFRNGRQMEYLDATNDLPKPKAPPKEAAKSKPKKPKNSRAIEGAEDAVKCDGDTCTVDRAFVDKILSNPSLLAKQARVVPSRRGNEVKGFKFYGIRPRSLPKLFGMSNGDMVTSINGSPLTSIDEAMGLYTKLRRASNLTVVLERKGKSITKDISIR